MKPFDLTAAKAGKPLVTRDGRKARFVGNTGDGRRYSIAAAIDAEKDIETYTASGRRFGDSEESNFDLFMAPERRTVYVNLYRTSLGGGRGHISRWFHSKEDAEREGSETIEKAFVTVPIEIEV